MIAVSNARRALAAVSAGWGCDAGIDDAGRFDRTNARRRMGRALPWLLLALLCSCATPATGPTYAQSGLQPDPGRALVVFYRTGGFKGAAYDNSVFVNNVLAARLPPESYTAFQLAPGAYQFNSGPPGTPRHLHLAISVVAGQTYYLRYHAGNSLASGDGLEADSAQVANGILGRGYRHVPPIQLSF